MREGKLQARHSALLQTGAMLEIGIGGRNSFRIKRAFA